VSIKDTDNRQTISTDAKRLRLIFLPSSLKVFFFAHLKSSTLYAEQGRERRFTP
jgi:hypothetical protein